jgi:sarcosine oxidase subunit gamma
MAENMLQRRSALDGLALPTREGQVRVSDAGWAARFVFRGVPEHLGEAFGPVPSTKPLRAQTKAGRAALWLGPDEWLLIADGEEAEAIEPALRSAIGDRPSSLIDVSHRQAGLLIEGPKAAELINCGCPLDLHSEAFPPGMCTRTVLAKAEIVLWRTSADTFRLEVWRSYAPYVVGLLGEAVRDLT